MAGQASLYDSGPKMKTDEVTPADMVTVRLNELHEEIYGRDRVIDKLKAELERA